MSLKNKCLQVSFLVFLILFITELPFCKEAWLGDAGDYWTYGEHLVAGKFSLDSIDGFRGYFFPLWLAVTNLAGGGSRIGWLIINAALVSFFLTVLLPQLTGTKIENNKGMIFSLILPVFLIILFRGVIVYPLSDLFALIIMSCSVWMMKLAIQKERTRFHFLYLIFMGVFAYWAYNVRTIYLFADFALLCIYIILLIRKHSRGSRLKEFFIFFVSFSGGCIFGSIPQIIMNYKNLHIFSPMVPTKGLMLQQMLWGLQYQRYDTYLGTDPAHPSPRVFFIDSAGQQILELAGNVSLDGWGDYFRLFLSHPIDFLSIYAKHLVNMILPCWPDIYVTDLSSVKWLLGLFGVTILFIAVYALMEGCLKNQNGLIWFIPLLIPAILIIPGAVEGRFALPFYIFALSQLSLNLDTAKLKQKLTARKWTVLTIYTITMALCFAVWSGMLASESVTKLLL